MINTKNSQRIGGILLLLLFCSITQALASDEGELRAAFEDFLTQISEKNANGVVQHMHPDAVVFARNRLFAIDWKELGQDELGDFLGTFFDDVISAEIVPIEVKYRIYGDTGIVWGHSQLAVDARRGSGSNLDARFSASFAKLNGVWKLIHWHGSAPPVGQRAIM